MIKVQKICFVTAVPMTVEAFLLDYIRAVEELAETTVITNASDPHFLKNYGLKTKVIKIPIERKISPFQDFVTLLKLFNNFQATGYNVVHSVTPKAGLLAMMASYLAKVPIRIHTFTGQVWATKKGIKRWLLKKMDQLIVLCATHVLADSKSQRDFIVTQGVADEKKVGIIGNGSISGVDTSRFSMNLQAREEIRRKLCIKEDDFVFLFLGRLNREKGVLDLIAAFRDLAAYYQHVHLIIVGPDEEGIMGAMAKINLDSASSRIHYEGMTRSPERYISAADCLCLPSYREGFGLVVIEGAAGGIPAIGSRIYGIVDAIEDGVTGLLHDPGNIQELYRCMEWMIQNREKRLLMGERAKERARRLFSREQMVKAFVSFYQGVLNANRDVEYVKEGF